MDSVHLSPSVVTAPYPAAHLSVQCPSFVPCLRALLLLPVLLFLFVADVRQAVRSEGVVLPQVISRSLFVWPDSHEIRRRVVRHSQQGSKYGAEFADRQFAEFDHTGSWSEGKREFPAERILEA